MRGFFVSLSRFGKDSWKACSISGREMYCLGILRSFWRATLVIIWIYFISEAVREIL